MKSKFQLATLLLCTTASFFSYADAKEEAQAIALCKKSVEIEQKQLASSGQEPAIDTAFAVNTICPTAAAKNPAYWQCVVSRQEAGESAGYARKNCTQ